MTRAALPVLALLVAALAACAGERPHEVSDGGTAHGTLQVFCGADRERFAPLLDDFSARTGVSVAPTFGGDGELVGRLVELGAYTGVDVIVSADAASLGPLSQAGMLVTLPEELLARAPDARRSARGEWIGIGGSDDGAAAAVLSDDPHALDLVTFLLPP